MKPVSPPFPSTVHASARSERRVASVLGIGLVAAVVALLALDGAFGAVKLVPLVILMVFAEHRDRLFDDETSMSGSIVVAMASVVALHDVAPVLGPLLCGAAAGLYWPHLRAHAWSKVVINSATIAFASASAAVVFGCLTRPALNAEFFVAAGAATISYWCANSVLLGAATALLGRAPFARTTIDLLRSETQMLVFAVAGALCGLLFLEVGLWAGAISLIVVLVAVDLLVISRPRPSSTRANHAGLATTATRVAGGGLAALAAFVLGTALYPVVGAVLGAAAGIIGLAVASLIALRRRSGIWDVQLAIGLALADAPYVAVASVAGGVGAATTLGIGAVVAIAGALAVGVVLSRRRRSIEQARRLDDTEILAMLELVRAERRQPQLG